MAAVLGCSYEVWRSARKDRKRRKQQQQRSRSGSAGSQRWTGYGPEPAGKSVGFKVDGEADKRPNGTHKGPANAKDYKPLASSEAMADALNDKKSLVKGALLQSRVKVCYI